MSIPSGVRAMAGEEQRRRAAASSMVAAAAWTWRPLPLLFLLRLLLQLPILSMVVVEGRVSWLFSEGWMDVLASSLGGF